VAKFTAGVKQKYTEEFATGGVDTVVHLDLQISPQFF
jgi:hypothetical protein